MGTTKRTPGPARGVDFRDPETWELKESVPAMYATNRLDGTISVIESSFEPRRNVALAGLLTKVAAGSRLVEAAISPLIATYTARQFERGTEATRALALREEARQ
jgi:hypothetical protein